MVAYSEDDNEKMSFTLHGRGAGTSDYIAVGLSTDDKMGGDLVLACNVGSNAMVAAWNVEGGQNNEGGVEGVTFEEESVVVNGGVATCKFKVREEFLVGEGDLSELTF